MNRSANEYDFSVVLAVDPGGTTGVAWHVAHVPVVDSTQVEGGYPGFFDWWHQMFDPPMGSVPPTLVIVEDFIITPRTAKLTAQPDAHRIIGGLAFWCQVNDVPMLTPPASDKTFGSDNKLKALGWYKPGQGHGNDALRHLLNQLGPELRYPPMLKRLAEISEDL